MTRNPGAGLNPTAQRCTCQPRGQPAVQPANQGGQANPAGGAAQPNTQPAGQGNQADPNNAAQHNLEIKQHRQTKRVKEITKQHLIIMQHRQIKHSQRKILPAAAQPAAPVAANAQTQDPNASNTGEGSIDQHNI